MKRFIFMILILIIASSNAFAEKSWEDANNSLWDEYYNENALRIIYGGEIELLDNRLDEINLAALNKKQLRLLRNMIYAKHGYSFKSNDLKIHMSRFEWYVPSDEFYEGLLSDIDIKNKECILKFENGIPESSIKSSDLEGTWQKDMPIMASGWSRRFVFQDSRFEFYYSQMNNLKRIQSFSGKYEILNNRLILYVAQEEIYDGGQLGNENTGAWGYLLENYEMKERSIFPEIILSFPISDIKLDYLADREFEYIELGDFQFYKMNL